MPAPPSNPTEAPDRNAPLQLSEEDLIKRACNFEEYSSPAFVAGVVIRNGLENTEDLIAYGISDTDQKELWKAEIARLAAAVADLDDSIHFAGSDDFKLDSKEAHANLAGLADKMLVALNVVIHDSQGVLFKHLPDLVGKVDLLEDSRATLERFVTDHSGDDDDDDDDDERAEPRDSHASALNINHANYFEFVNYVTATLARVLCKAASGRTWHHTILAKFAKMAAKMKVVSGDLRGHVATSLQNTPPAKVAAKVRRPPEGGQEPSMPEGLAQMLQMLRPNQGQPSFVGPRSAHRFLRDMYFVEEASVQYPVFRIYQYILLSLRGQNTLRTALTTSYEMCAMLYKTGYENFPVFLFQDICGEYLGSSSDENINVSHASLQVLNLAVNGLMSRRPAEKKNCDWPKEQCAAEKNNSGNGSSPFPTATPPTPPSRPQAPGVGTAPPPCPDGPKSVGTTITWHYAEQPGVDGGAGRGSIGDFEPKRMRLDTMSDVITIMVPLLLASPNIVHQVTMFIGVLAFAENLNSGTGPVLYRPTEFKANFCLTTAEYQKKWGDQRERGSVSQLSASLMARDTLLSWKPGKQMPRRARTMDMELPSSVAGHKERKRELREEQDQIRHSLEQLEHASKTMEDWVFEENGVRVRCGWYVGVVCTMAAVLVFGGIAAGITMGERLPGVDPFNITTFSWVLAAFVILIAKSVHVASWTWWDFLHRQVLCRSVSELRAVTGIDDQLILARLLQDESRTPLQTRGPYNMVFHRKASGGEGFSIDRPLKIRTMLLSGLIMIQVQAPYHGKFLVCLDLRRGTDYNVVLQTRESAVHKEECIVSDRLTDEPPLGTGHRIILKKEMASWSRVIGVYGQKDSVFC